jgi:hypothetical protein
MRVQPGEILPARRKATLDKLPSRLSFFHRGFAAATMYPPVGMLAVTRPFARPLARRPPMPRR